VFVLGSGSNILVADRGIRGVVIDNRARGEAEAGTATWQVESGMSFAGFARKMCRAGLDGLTWAIGIPGTLGGAVVYNAGAYGGCLGDVLTLPPMLLEKYVVAANQIITEAVPSVSRVMREQVVAGRQFRGANEGEADDRGGGRG
jgi:UDP-N-acetylenolpyruvoylglucosamine reductase